MFRFVTRFARVRIEDSSWNRFTLNGIKGIFSGEFWSGGFYPDTLIQAWKTCIVSPRLEAKNMGKTCKTKCAIFGKCDIFSDNIGHSFEIRMWIFFTIHLCQILIECDVSKKKVGFSTQDIQVFPN